MEKKQNAVEWLEEQIKDIFYVAEASEMTKKFKSVYEQAKQMEKEQMIDAHIEGQRVFDKHPHTQWTNDQAEQYYNETYGNG